MTLPPLRTLLVDVDNRVATLTLNRPDKRNALSAELVNELIVALEACRDDDAVRVVVITGAGGIFCSGGDLSQLSGAAGSESVVPFRGGYAELNLLLTDYDKPIIAKIRRYALAGALGLVCGAHFAIADNDAGFGTPEIRRGLFPMMVMAPMLRVLARRDAVRLLLTGARIEAPEAVRIGLITAAVPASRLDDEVAELATVLASNPPAVTRLGLRALRHQDDLTLTEALPYLQGMLGQVLATEDAAEGLRAFLEKRDPAWR